VNNELFEIKCFVAGKGALSLLLVGEGRHPGRLGRCSEIFMEK